MGASPWSSRRLASAASSSLAASPVEGLRERPLGLGASDAADEGLLGFAAGFEAFEIGAQRGDPGLQLGDPQLVSGTAGGFALEGRQLGAIAKDALGRVVNEGWRGPLAQGDPRAGGVEHADGLVGKLAAADVATGEADGLGDGFVEDADAEVGLHQRHHAAQHRRSQGLPGLVDLHHLEAAGQGGVLLEILFVLGPGGRGDGAQLAPGEGRLEQVGGIVLARLAAGADQGVGFVDEQDDRPRALADLVDDVLEAVLELALHARAGLQQAEVEHLEFDLGQRLRDVTGGDAQGQAFDHGGLADPGLAGEDGIVLAPPQQDVDELADLAVAADHRVELAVTCALGERGGELIEGRHARLGGLGGRRRVAALDPRTDRYHGFCRARGEAVEVMPELVHGQAGE